MDALIDALVDEPGLWLLLTSAALAVLVILRRPLGALLRLLLRCAAGLGAIWLFNLAGGLIGVQVGLNPLTGLAVGLLGLPGVGLLLLLQCV